MSDMSKDELDKLLPFYVNGTLDGEEKTAVEQRLAEDPAFDAEKCYLEALRSKVKELEIEGSPGELGLARLQASIQKEMATAEVHTPAPEQDNVVQGWWRPVAVAACIAVAVLSSGQIHTAFNDDGLTTASGGSGSGPVLQIFFDEAATEKTIRMLLVKKKLNIIEGPTAVGFYRVELTGNQGDAVLQALIRDLEKNKAVTEVLEE
ncbi:MAG: hypothetical protein ABJN40_20045 [Sneathiella sp.]